MFCDALPSWRLWDTRFQPKTDDIEGVLTLNLRRVACRLNEGLRVKKFCSILNPGGAALSTIKVEPIEEWYQSQI